uniref:Carboxylesterase type B domain-containing protein n=1 Tax=Phlebotomus papatasi TaxID=29031 RepID=A0A1B0F0L2_PHLPP
MYGDRCFCYPMVTMVNQYITYADVKKNPVFIYEFAYESEYSLANLLHNTEEYFGVGHLDDLPYLFTMSSNFQPFEIDSPESRMSDIWVRTMVNFVARGEIKVWRTLRPCTTENASPTCDRQVFERYTNGDQDESFVSIANNIDTDICSSILSLNFKSEKPISLQPEVCAASGCVRGKVESGRKKPYDAFYGIPYAEPPVGKLRFESPVPYSGWTGYWDASYPRDDCIQRNGSQPGQITSGSEDCLYLNVYRPSTWKGVKKFPVMVWIHGGSFIGFSSKPELFGPEYIMDNGEVILVTMNYRLGILGFLCSGDEAVKGNFGLKDQQMALQWVAKNIEYFGGDASSVTLSGQSAGATSAHLHMMNSKSQALFHRVILMSGTALAPFIYPIDYASQFRTIANFTELANYDTASTYTLAYQLKKTNVTTLVLTVARLYAFISTPIVPIRPCIEGNWEDAFMTEDPRKLWAEGRYVQKPILVGTVSKEGTTLSPITLNEFLLQLFNRNIYDYLPIQMEFQPRYMSDVLTYYFGGKKCGCVRGKFESGRKKSYDAFYGIPYAEPPVGKLRFESPVPYSGWTGYWDASYPRDDCLQENLYLPGYPISGSEDCLFLNVYRPSSWNRKKKLPVLIWIHMGSFFAFSSNPALVGPEYLMDNGEVILVTMNYRLGILGFLCSGDEAVKGNFGLKDQQLALKWVATNIEYFGGDSSSITLAGHGAGGISTNLHMLNPKSQALFHRAIMMSGVALTPMIYPIDFEAQFRKVAKLIELPDWEAGTTTNLAYQMKKLDGLKLILAHKYLFLMLKTPPFSLRPCIEGDWEGAFMTEDPRTVWAEGRFVHKPFVVEKSSNISFKKSILSPPEVCAECGCVRGVFESGRKKPYDAFYGIPYAEPPVGKLRFENTVPHSGWSGYWDASYPRDDCIQSNVSLPGQTTSGSEDCLYLNVYRPSTWNGKKKLPVVVYIHGGSFLSFSSNPDQFGPEYIMDNGEVILVTLNYRLGILGFLCSGDEAVKGNFGLKDQQMALQWVATNIEYFGGDSSSVTLAGQSSGASCAHLHMMNSKSQALFHRVILMSGTALAPFMYPIDHAAQFRTIANLTGLKDFDTAATYNLAYQMKKVDAATFVETVELLYTFFATPPAPIRPCIEGDWVGAFMTEDPRKVWAEGRYVQKPILVGTVKNDGASLSLITLNEDLLDQFNRNIYNFLPIQMEFQPRYIYESPVPHSGWSEYWDASYPRDNCLQKNYFLPGQPVSGSEDCLYLNVYRPSTWKGKRNFR